MVKKFNEYITENNLNGFSDEELKQAERDVMVWDKSLDVADDIPEEFEEEFEEEEEEEFEEEEE